MYPDSRVSGPFRPPSSVLGMAFKTEGPTAFRFLGYSSPVTETEGLRVSGRNVQGWGFSKGLPLTLKNLPF